MKPENVFVNTLRIPSRKESITIVRNKGKITKPRPTCQEERRMKLSCIECTKGRETRKREISRKHSPFKIDFTKSQTKLCEINVFPQLIAHHPQSDNTNNIQLGRTLE